MIFISNVALMCVIKSSCIAYQVMYEKKVFVIQVVIEKDLFKNVLFRPSNITW